MLPKTCSLVFLFITATASQIVIQLRAQTVAPAEVIPTQTAPAAPETSLPRDPIHDLEHLQIPLDPIDQATDFGQEGIVPVVQAPPGLRDPTVPLIPPPPAVTEPSKSNPVFDKGLGNAKSPFEVCISLPFELTEENFDDAEVVSFVRNFTLQFQTTSFYQKYGLLSSIGYYYLGRPDYRCGIGLSASCSTTCQEVLANVADLQLARKVYFTLISGRHYIQHMEAVDRAITAAGFTISQWIPQMSFSFFWWRPDDYELMYELSMDIFNSAWLLGINWFVPNIIPMHGILGKVNDHLAKAIEIGRNEVVQALLAKYSAIQRAMDNYKINAVTRHQAARAFLSAFVPDGDLQDKSQAKQFGNDPEMFKLWDGIPGRLANQLNSAQMGMWISEVVQVVKRTNQWNVNAVANGLSAVYDDGSSPFTMVLATKAFIQPFEDGNRRFSNFIEHGVTRALQFQLFSAALTSQHTYITCTKTFQDKNGNRVDSCALDNSGPQNLKSCVGDRVCYMYRWNHKSPAHSQHVDEPHGATFLKFHPFNIEVDKLIRSSVGTHLESLKKHTDHDSVANLWSGHGIESIYDQEAPGSFSIPVCIRDEENWNTHIKPYGFLQDDWNPRSSKKIFPCACGSHWGDYTEDFWGRMGFNTLPNVKQYIADNCPAFIHKKIQDPLELFIMDCKLGVRKKKLYIPGFGRFANDKHPLCDAVLAKVSSLDAPLPKDVDPGTRLGLECRLGLVKDKRAKEWCKSFGVDYVTSYFSWM